MSIMRMLIDGGASSASIQKSLEIATLSGSGIPKEMVALLETSIVYSGG